MVSENLLTSKLSDAKVKSSLESDISEHGASFPHSKA